MASESAYMHYKMVKTVYDDDIKIFGNKLDPKLSCRPFKMPHLLRNWPASAKWDFEHLLENYAFRTTVIEIGSKYTDDNWKQEIMTIYEYIELLKKQEDASYEEYGKNGDLKSSMGMEEAVMIKRNIYFSKYYLAQNALLTQIPKLMDDIDIPDLISNINPNPEINCWFGPTATFTPFHTDPKDNLFCQVYGEKYIKLKSKDDKQKIVCLLYGGESLFIPAGWQHEVLSMTKSFGVNFWV